MNEEGIVEFGKRIFDDYYSKKISLERLMKLIDERNADSNDYGVLGCYCEKDEEVTFQLHKLRVRKQSKKYHKEFTTEPYVVKMTSMILMNEIQITGIPLDRYFKCDRFAKMLVKEYRKSWGEDYIKLFKQIEERVIHFNFPSWNHIFETYVK